MLTWLAGELIAHNMRRLREGGSLADGKDVRRGRPLRLSRRQLLRPRDNRYVIWGHVAWGKMRAYEVYEDTQASKALDAYLERLGKQQGATA